MRFQLGSSILLALVVGLICVCPVRSLYLDETQSDEVAPSSAQSDQLTSNLPSSLDSALDKADTSENEDLHEQTKRNDIGMPSSSLGSNTDSEQDNSNASQEKSSSQEGSLSKPVNEPSNANLEQSQNSEPVAEQAGATSSPSEASAKMLQIASSTARGLGSQLVSSISNMAGSNQEQDQSMGQQQGQVADNLPAPVIIENNRRQEAPQTSTENQQQQLQSSQQQSQEQKQASPQARMGPTSSSEIELPSTGSGNSSLPASTARTFESWTNCVGASSNKYGTCKNDVECKKYKGQDDGSCMGGLGVCCVMALTCGDKSMENNTFFANPDFPDASWEARLCEVEIKKKHKKILQIMIEFEEFELAPPNHDGECHTDVFQVKLASNRPSPYSLLRMCGQNTGQHMYLDVSQVEEGIVLSVATSGGGYPRRWSIRIVQMDDKNFLLAPPGCLQYYTDTVGHFRSFNLGKNLRNLYYAICFRIDNGYSGIRFTSNFFGMHGPHCRRKIGGPPMIGGRYNGTYEAHPHHLVIPPPGYAPPPPKPRYPPQAQYPPPQPYGPPGVSYPHPPPPPPMMPPTYQPQQSRRYKRLAYHESIDSVDVSERYPRTFHESKEHKFEEKELKHEHGSYYPGPPPPTPGYGPGYGHQTGGYGPPSAPPSYYGHQQEYYPPPPRHYYEHSKAEYKEDKFGHKFDDKFGHKFDDKFGHKFEDKEAKKGLWKDKKDDSFDKFGHKHEAKYGHSYGPHPSYGYEQHQPTHGPTGYGNYGGGYGYGGEYHHKEIDKFGKKYEHLEYKHEKNHLKKEEKEDKKESKWWPMWGKKEEKKDKKDKDKFEIHHEALFPMMHIPEMPHCEPRFCGQNDVITFPPSGDSIAEMCGNRFNRGRGPKVISGSPLVVYVSNRGQNRGAGFDMNYEQIFFTPKPY